MWTDEIAEMEVTNALFETCGWCFDRFRFATSSKLVSRIAFDVMHQEGRLPADMPSSTGKVIRESLNGIAQQTMRQSLGPEWILTADGDDLRAVPIPTAIGQGRERWVRERWIKFACDQFAELNKEGPFFASCPSAKDRHALA